MKKNCNVLNVWHCFVLILFEVFGESSFCVSGYLILLSLFFFFCSSIVCDMFYRLFWFFLMIVS